MASKVIPALVTRVHKTVRKIADKAIAVAICSDGYSKDSDKYLGVTAHMIGPNDRKVVVAVLYFGIETEVHTDGISTGNFVHKVVTDPAAWGIPSHKLVSYTTDGAAEARLEATTFAGHHSTVVAIVCMAHETDLLCEFACKAEGIEELFKGLSAKRNLFNSSGVLHRHATKHREDAILVDHDAAVYAAAGFGAYRLPMLLMFL